MGTAALLRLVSLSVLLGAHGLGVKWEWAVELELITHGLLCPAAPATSLCAPRLLPFLGLSLSVSQ